MSQPPQDPPPGYPPGQPPSGPPGYPPPRFPPHGFPPPGPGPRRHWGNSILLGIVGGVAMIGLYVFLSLAVGSLLDSRNDPVSGLLLGLLGWGFPLAYLAGAIVLTVRPATTRLGAGLLIAIGVSLLIAAGVCFALLAALSGAMS